MKKLVLAAAFIGAASFASAGNPTSANMSEDGVVTAVEGVSSELSGAFLPILLVLIIAAAAA